MITRRRLLQTLAVPLACSAVTRAAASRATRFVPAAGAPFRPWSAGLDVFDPAVSFLARGDGASAWYGWPTNPEMERLRHAWFDAADQATQKKICQQLQLQTFADAPDIPLGQIFQPTAYRTTISAIPDGFAKFWGVEKAG